MDFENGFLLFDQPASVDILVHAHRVLVLDGGVCGFFFQLSDAKGVTQK